MRSMVLYFAYGSNMNPARMAKRCPGAITLGRAKLPHYRLAERLYADIEFEEESELHGVLYCITENHLHKLDSYEGYPKVYRRIWLDVIFRGEIYQAVTYEMSMATKFIRAGIPFPDEYREICSEGAKYHHVKNYFIKRKVKKMKTVKLIVYGTLMSGERNHKFCKNALSIEPCTVTGTLYDTGCGFPAFQPEGENIVQAELIEIPLRDWFAIDRLEGYPRLYDRQLYPCTLPDGTTDSGWIYIMHTLPTAASIIENGSWKEYRHG